MMLFDVNAFRIAMALLMFSIASYTDIKKREIDDRIWIVFGSLAVVLIFFEPNIPHILDLIGISLIVAPVALVIWRIGFFGGADAFALIVLAALAPSATFTSSTINPFTTLTNAVILSVIPVVANLLYNISAILRHQDIFKDFENETRRKKMTAMFIGHRAKNPKFGFAIEKREGDSRKLDFALKNADNTEFCSSPDTWITPGIPYILYIFGGFAVQLVYGDVIFNMLKMMF